MLLSMLLAAVALTGCKGEIGNASDGARTTARDDGPVIPPGPNDPPPPPIPESCTEPGLKPAFMPTLRITSEQYDHMIRDIFDGQIAPSTRFPPTSEREGYSAHPDANIVSLLAAEEVMQAAEDVALQVAENLPQLLPCASSGNAACAETFINQYGERAFRRPLTLEEIGDFMDLYDEVSANNPFDASIAIVASAMLQAPQFLYVLELGRATATSGIIALDDYEIAQRLALLLIDSVPDDALLAAASRGDLTDPVQLESQARRLLADERAIPALTKFFGEWLEVEPVNPINKDRAIFAALDDDLAEAMNREFGEFIAMVFRDFDGSLDALMSSSISMVNRPLAEFYGLDPNVSAGANDWVQVELPSTERAGVLTKPAFLATHAHQTLTSPVFRGNLVWEQVLCFNMANPPAGAMARAPEFPENANPRVRSDILRSVSECASCHNLMDPIGLGFENYDAIGAFRTDYRSGEAVDSSGEVVGLSTFIGAVDLGQQLSTADVVRSCLPKQMFRYMFGRTEGPRDQCALEEITTRFAASNYDLREMIVAAVMADTFRYRTTPEVGGTQ